MKSIEALKDKYKGRDIWIIASGPSAGYVDPEFFRGKIVLGVNRVWVRFDPDYVVIKEHQVAELAAQSGYTVLVSQFHCGGHNGRALNCPGDIYVFEHEDNALENVNLDIIGTEKIVVSFSTITSALHLAAYMGAANIILLGHDCGMLDEERNFPGYPAPLETTPGFYEDFLGRIEDQTLAVKERLMQVYGCRIYSLNPFINFGLEGHEYTRAADYVFDYAGGILCK